MERGIDVGFLSPGRLHGVLLCFKIISSKSQKRSSSLEYQVLFSLRHRLILRDLQFHILQECSESPRP